MNRDTLYSSGVFDLEAGDLHLSLPDAGDRYLSAQIISEDHYTMDVFYAPGARRYSRDDVGSRYAFVIVRTLAVGWGGLPKEAAVYRSFFPDQNDGETPYELTLKDVPARGFWSVSVYNAEGYFEKNAKGLYSVNNYNATPNRDGSYTIHFGGDPEADNYLPIMPGWNYTLRLYQAEPEVLK